MMSTAPQPYAPVLVIFGHRFRDPRGLVFVLSLFALVNGVAFVFQPGILEGPFDILSAWALTLSGLFGVGLVMRNHGPLAGWKILNIAIVFSWVFRGVAWVIEIIAYENAGWLQVSRVTGAIAMAHALQFLFMKWVLPRMAADEATTKDRSAYAS
jgi:hypothetical protein